jgi:hypothetical protein
MAAKKREVQARSRKLVDDNAAWIADFRNRRKLVDDNAAWIADFRNRLDDVESRLLDLEREAKERGIGE